MVRISQLFSAVVSAGFYASCGLLFGLPAGHAADLPVLQYDRQTFRLGDATWDLTLLAGYRLELLVQAEGPRILTLAEDGRFYAGSRKDKIYQFRPPYTSLEVFAELSRYPHAVAFRGDALFVARTDGVYRTAYPPQRKRTLSEDDFTLVAALPSGGGHASRTVGIGPDNRIYASLGISGNCSDQYVGETYPFDHRRGGIFVLNEQGQSRQWQPYAAGLRNPIGFDWHPDTGVLYASNNGPDHLGYELPREYFSRIDAGSFHGMPWFWLNQDRFIRDACIGSKPPRTGAVLPVATFPARNAPMAVAFVPKGALIPEVIGSAVVALHGSWATQPSGGFIGKKKSRRPPWIALVHFNQGKASGTVMPLLEGLQNASGKRLARPMGLAFGSDGTLYFTSDGGEMQGLFRIRRNKG